MQEYITRTGETINLSSIPEDEQKWLDWLQAKIDTGADYLTITNLTMDRNTPATTRKDPNYPVYQVVIDMRKKLKNGQTQKP
jgi:hypothetical protein